MSIIREKKCVIYYVNEKKNDNKHSNISTFGKCFLNLLQSKKNQKLKYQP